MRIIKQEVCFVIVKGRVMEVLKVVGIAFLVLVVIVVISSLAAQIVLKWAKRRYSPPEERDWVYPGDELLSEIDRKNIRTVSSAITIDAPVDEVYRWLYQFGGSKSGSISSEMAERVFGRMSVFNRYEIQQEWQTPDALMPGDFQDWDRSGMGTEYTDVVADKYIMAFSDTKHPPRARGAYAIAGKGIKRMCFNWGFYFVPLKGGKTRYINRWSYSEPDNPVMRFMLYNAIYIGGSAMGRWHVEYVKQLAEGRPKVHRHCKAFRKVVGMNHYAPDAVQNATDCPIIRDGRNAPAVSEIRPPKLADPSWPPVDGPWSNIDKEYYAQRLPVAIQEAKSMLEMQMSAANKKIAALEEELAALEERG